MSQMYCTEEISSIHVKTPKRDTFNVFEWTVGLVYIPFTKCILVWNNHSSNVVKHPADNSSYFDINADEKAMKKI